MQSMNEFKWAQRNVEEVTGRSREQREKEACERRLKQMAKKREKDAARMALKTVSGNKEYIP